MLGRGVGSGGAGRVWVSCNVWPWIRRLTRHICEAAATNAEIHQYFKGEHSGETRGEQQRGPQPVPRDPMKHPWSQEGDGRHQEAEQPADDPSKRGMGAHDVRDIGGYSPATPGSEELNAALLDEHEHSKQHDSCKPKHSGCRKKAQPGIHRLAPDDSKNDGESRGGDRERRHPRRRAQVHGKKRSARRPFDANLIECTQRVSQEPARVPDPARRALSPLPWRPDAAGGRALSDWKTAFRAGVVRRQRFHVVAAPLTQQRSRVVDGGSRHPARYAGAVCRIR